MLSRVQVSMNCSMPGFPVLHYLWVCSNSCPLSHWYDPAISSSVAPISSCPQSFPASFSVDYCCVIPYLKTYWLKTKLISCFSQSCELTGLSWTVLLLHMTEPRSLTFAFSWSWSWPGTSRMSSPLSVLLTMWPLVLQESSLSFVLAPNKGVKCLTSFSLDHHACQCPIGWSRPHGHVCTQCRWELCSGRNSERCVVLEATNGWPQMTSENIRAHLEGVHTGINHL